MNDQLSDHPASGPPPAAAGPPRDLAAEAREMGGYLRRTTEGFGPAGNPIVADLLDDLAADLGRTRAERDALAEVVERIQFEATKLPDVPARSLGAIARTCGAALSAYHAGRAEDREET